mmetsp:Transcript_10162/g.29640  ORF Transcript_10162/g.29640 Transcript_10162/m.29640 type:complete len:208 (-) Transcript_10162:506-1129(-)
MAPMASSACPGSGSPSAAAALAQQAPRNPAVEACRRRRNHLRFLLPLLRLAGHTLLAGPGGPACRPGMGLGTAPGTGRHMDRPDKAACRPSRHKCPAAWRTSGDTPGASSGSEPAAAPADRRRALAPSPAPSAAAANRSNLPAAASASAASAAVRPAAQTAVVPAAAGPAASAHAAASASAALDASAAGACRTADPARCPSAGRAPP